MPHSTVTYSLHARERMRERGIPERLVAASLANPDRVRMGSRGNRIAEKRSDSGATLRVVFVDRIGPDGRYTHVVTVMWAWEDSGMRIRLDPDVNALYIAFRDGPVARTVELAEEVYADMDEHDEPLGLEFVNADDFLPFLRERVGDASLPPRLRELLGAAA